MEIIYQQRETLIKQQPLSFSLSLSFTRWQKQKCLRFCPLAAAFFSVTLFVHSPLPQLYMCRGVRLLTANA